MTTCFPSLQYSIDELYLDTDCLFDLVLSDPELEGLLPNLSHSAAVEAVEEAMRVLHSAPAPQVQWAGIIISDLAVSLCTLTLKDILSICMHAMSVVGSFVFQLYSVTCLAILTHAQKKV